MPHSLKRETNSPRDHPFRVISDYYAIVDNAEGSVDVYLMPEGRVYPLPDGGKEIDIKSWIVVRGIKPWPNMEEDVREHYHLWCESGDMEVTDTNEKVIWDFLIGKLKNAYGVAGLMGNLYAESALNPTNLQGAYERKLGMNDEAYTSAVDDGSYDNFVHDQAGYGLAQWTYWSRKKNLLNYAKEQATSIGDLNMQLKFLWLELQGYKAVLEVLKSASTVREASDKVMLSYEHPADQSKTAQKRRASYGQKYYDLYADQPKDNTSGKEGSEETMASIVYVGSARGDENGGAYGGAAGDQTGREVSVQPWYHHEKDWRVFRAKDPEAADKMGGNMQAACDNACIGYDQHQRLTLYNAAKPFGFDCSKVTTKVETDCSALARVCAAFAGIMLADFNTETQAKVMLNSGAFVELVGDKYTKSSDYLRRGDVLVTCVRGHTVIVLNDGAKASKDMDTQIPALKLGDRLLLLGCKGPDVVELQENLMKLGYELPAYGADGDFGDETDKAVRDFQTKSSLTVDGEFGSKSYKAMIDALAVLDKPVKTYTVTISGVDEVTMASLLQAYETAVAQEE